MKHRVKLVKVDGDIIRLRVDGELCSYLIQRPTPLGLHDAEMLRAVMDTRLLESLVRDSGLGRPQERLYRRFCRLVDSWRHKIPFPCELVAAYLEAVGVEVSIDKKTKGIVILKSDIDKIRKGDLG